MDHAEALVRALLPKLVTFVKEGALLPLEIALAIDALSRYGDGAEPLVPGGGFGKEVGMQQGLTTVNFDLRILPRSYRPRQGGP